MDELNGQGQPSIRKRRSEVKAKVKVKGQGLKVKFKVVGGVVLAFSWTLC